MPNRFKLTVAWTSSPAYKRIKDLKERSHYKFSILVPPIISSGLISPAWELLNNSDSVETWIDFEDKDLLTQKMTLISNGIVDRILEFKSQIDPLIVEDFVPDFMSLLKEFILSDPYVNIISMKDSDSADIFGFQ